MNNKLREQVISLLIELNIPQKCFERINKKYKNNYIRAINYHEIYDFDVNNFEKQIKMFF